MKHGSHLLLALLAVLWAGACGDPPREDPAGDVPAEAAAPLTVYSGGDGTTLGPLLVRFTQKTGIPVDVRYGTAAELAATLEVGGNLPADLFFAPNATTLDALSEAGLLRDTRVTAVGTLGLLSGHADAQELIDFLSTESRTEQGPPAETD